MPTVVSASRPVFTLFKNLFILGNEAQWKKSNHRDNLSKKRADSPTDFGSFNNK